uniref:Gypsy retrotransposon integrase-like protein 1 n=1 Tax=Anolis carolinensis TaxID=28377 RepID=A0A803SS84_ANOCA
MSSIWKDLQKCGKKNHYARLCRSRVTNPVNIQARQHIHELNVSNLMIGKLDEEMKDTQITNKAGWYADISIRDCIIKFKLDTGAEANVLPFSIFSRIPGAKQMSKSKVVLVAYGGTKIQPMGAVEFDCITAKGVYNLLFYVTDCSTTPLLGRPACENLGLIYRVDLIQAEGLLTQEKLLSLYPEVFQGLGEFQGHHHIHTDPTVVPVIQGCRRVPFAIHDRLKDTLDQMENMGVITKVVGPTDWVSSLVITEKKNGSLRICLDPRDLNKAVRRQHYTIPTVEEVLSHLAGKKIFTIIDEKDGYWQVKLDKASSRLCTFNTPWGRYCFNRLPFGLKSSSEVFQQKNQEKFGHIKGVYMIADDMIIAAETSKQHDEILHQVMETARVKNIKFNKEKIQFRVNSVRYMGHIVTAEGVRPDTEKVKAIQEMKPPNDRQGVLRFLGSVQYLAKYIPKEAELTAPLRSLLKKNMSFQWMPEHQKAFEAIKQKLCDAPVLQYFDVTKPVVIQADASKDGLGACLLQDNKPVSYASRALSSAEKNYAQIEKELLAVVYAVQKFHQYVFGKMVLVQTDHKPLESIYKKPIGSAPARLQRMLLQLQKYQLNFVYTPGKLMYLADTLSRATVDHPGSQENPIGDEKVIYEVNTLAMHPDKMGLIQEATKRDPQLRMIQTYLNQGWPKYMRKVAPIAKSFWPVKDHLRYRDGALFMGERIIIPASQRQNVLAQLHESHQGIQRTKERARQLMYWPGMSKDIESAVGSCFVCACFAPNNQKEPLKPHEIPEGPWQKVGVDIFEQDNRSFLLVIDYFSKYPEVVSLPDKTARTVIVKMKSVFARHGTPLIVVSDNMPFASQEFKVFAKEWGFEQCFSSPGYPQSNGMVERAIQSIKQLTHKVGKARGDLYAALLEYRNTPVTGLSYSPAQILMGRMLRSKLPITTDLLCPRIPINVRQDLQRAQERQKHFYDRTARPLKPLREGDLVWMQSNNCKERWLPAVVIEKCKQPRSYLIKNQDGRVYRRNRRQLKQRNQTPETTIQGNTTYNGSKGMFMNKSDAHVIADRKPTYVTSHGRPVFEPVRYTP